MAMAVVLTNDGIEFVLTAVAAAELARMGVTHVTLVSGESTTGVVLEGWAFNPLDCDRGCHRAARPRGPGADAPLHRTHRGLGRITTRRVECKSQEHA